MDAWLRREAQVELQIAAAWCEEQRAELGGKFLDDFLATVEAMEASPELYVEIKGGVRRALLKRFPYAIFYLVEETHIQILGVKHSHGNPENWPTGAKQGVAADT